MKLTPDVHKSFLFPKLEHNPFNDTEYSKIVGARGMYDKLLAPKVKQ